jgi:hypothetical protein
MAHMSGRTVSENYSCASLRKKIANNFRCQFTEQHVDHCKMSCENPQFHSESISLDAPQPKIPELKMFLIATQKSNAGSSSLIKALSLQQANSRASLYIRMVQKQSSICKLHVSYL